MSETFNLNQFLGLIRTSDLAELEEGPPGSLFRAENIALDLTKKAYVCTGYKALSAAVTNGPASNLFYSSAIQALVFTNTAGDFYRCNPTTGAINLVQAGAFTAGAKVSWADWPLTNTLYGADGTNYQELTSTFVYTSRTAGSPLGAGVLIHQHKDTMFAVRPPGGSTACQVVPSSVGDPLTFSTADRFNCQDGGDRITAISTLNGVLRFHKPFGIWNVHGNTFSGTAKDLQKIFTNTGVGTFTVGGLVVYDTWEYFIGHDGFYRANETGYENLTNLIVGKLKERWISPPSASDGWVSIYKPFWGGDAGRTYILFCFQDSELINWHLYKFDTLLGTFTEETGFPEVIRNFAFSFDHLKTYLGGSKIFVFDNVPTRDGIAIRGNLVTNCLDFGHKGLMKIQRFLHNLVTDLVSTSIFIGTDGLYPLYSVGADFIDSNNTVVEMPEKAVSGILTQLRFEKSGGGLPLSNGAFFEYDVMGPRQGRSFSRSRFEVVEEAMLLAPPFKTGSVTTVNAQTTYTVTHGLGEVPEAVVACHAGYTMTSQAVVANIGRTSFDIVLPSNPGSGNTLYWVAVAPGKRLFDSYIRGLISITSGATAKTVNHNLDVAPGAVLVSKYANAALGQVLSAINTKQLVFTPEATSVSNYLSVIALKNGTIDTYFKCGIATGSPITHGLPTTPTAAIIIPNHSPLSNHGITAISSTQLTYTGTGSFHWAVFK